MKQHMPAFMWKKDKVLESKVSVLQGEIRQLKWALFGNFSECAKLRATLQANGIAEVRSQKGARWARVEARELFDLAWKYLWSSEALYIDLRTITIVTIDKLKCSKDGFRTRLAGEAASAAVIVRARTVRKAKRIMRDLQRIHARFVALVLLPTELASVEA